MRARWMFVGVAVFVVIFGAYAVSRYNGLVTRAAAVDSGWAQVENVLQRRADLVPNLVATVKGYAAHEAAVFASVADARARLGSARNPAEAAQADAALTGALARLIAIAEAYPELKAAQSFQSLQDELAGSENRIAVERRRYNEAVREYNALRLRFPVNLVARTFGFEAREYFEAAPGAAQAPTVQF
jgi:LemA protein